MQQSELIKVARLLKENEMRQAEQFIKSPYHNTNPTVLNLFQYIRRFHPELTSFKLKKEHVFSHLYPRKKKDLRKLSTPMSSLKKLLEQFIILQELKNDKTSRQRLLTRAYHMRADYEQFAGIVESRFSILKEQGFQDSAYFQEMLWLQEELYYHPGRGKYDPNEDSLAKLNQYLDQFFALSKLRFATDMNIRREVINEDLSYLIPVPPLIEHFEGLSSDNRLIRLYSRILQIQQHLPSEETYLECVEMLKEWLPQMKKKEKSYWLNCLINTGVFYSNKGFNHFEQKILPLYKLAISEDLLLYKGKLQSTTFLNVVVFSGVVGEFAWAKKFMEDHKEFLEPEEKEYNINLAWGYWFYFYSRKNNPKQKYLKKAHHCLSLIKYTSLPIDLRLRSLQLRVFFELDLFDGNEKVFFDFAKAFNRWLDRQEFLSASRVAIYKNFIRLTKQLARAYNQGLTSHTLLEEVKKEIEEENGIILKNWLMERVEELENSSTGHS